MSRYPNKSVKRKIEECQDDENEGGRAAKEVKKELASEEGPSFGNDLRLLRLLPEDWAPIAASCIQDDDGETNVEENSGRGSVSRGTSWTGRDASLQIQGSSSQLSVACKRFASGSSSFDCETQTYYFLPKSADDASSAGNVSQDGGEKAVNVKDHDSLVSVCCVIDCDSQLSERDSSVTYYGLPSSNTERSLWAEILGVVFADVPEETTQEICSKHFVASASSPDVRKSSPVPKSSRVPKAKTRKKRTCDILIAEEAEKVKQSMTAGRTKRTPKPNRNYDWAELIPLIKSEGDDLEDIEIPATKTHAKHPGVPGRRRKQPLDDIKKEEKENERPYMEVHIGVCNEAGIPDSEAEDYGANISLPSVPRAPPPKPKGRPHRIQDTCTQTDTGLCISRGPLREVKVQCNLTAEPLITCSSCSSIDWRRLDEQLSSVMSIIEGGLCNPVLARSLTKIIADITKPSHASNVLKMIAGIERDLLESGKDIILVSGQDDLEEVEIDNVIHQEEAPMTGMREITPKIWNKKTKVAKAVRVKAEEISYEDPDSLGLKEATDKDDEEFQPEYAALEEEEEDDDLEELDDDDDWDIRNEDESGVPIPRKKKPTRQRMRKEHMVEAGSGQEGSSSSAMNKNEEVILVTSAGAKPSMQQNRRRRRNDGDMRWIRQEHRCTECDKVFTTQRKHDLHYSHVHLGVPPWQGCHQCDDCGKTFTQKVSLNVHRMFKHGAPRRFHCGKCTYEGPTKEYLKRHMKVHTGERQYVCQECGKGLKSAESYKNHMVLHTNEGRFFCDLCKKAFNHKGAYTDHMHSHQESRDYACNYCGASFKAYKHVARHIRAVHLNDKRFICDICGTQHMTGFNLKNHLKKHGDIPFLPYSYQCPGCEAKFRGFQGLSAHLRVVHNSKPSEVGAEEVIEKPMVTPHPTRRPIKYHYSRISSSMLSDDSVAESKASKVGPETIFINCDEYVVSEVKDEEVECNVCEVNVETRYDNDEDFLVANSEGGERVIHIFSCTECSSMFTSESLRQEHMDESHY